MPHHDPARALFDRALELPVSDREPFVRSEAEGDEELMAEVLGLLEHAGEETTKTGPIREDRRSLPDRIGHFKILGVLGEGGFGVVYEAEQTEPVKRRVALKVIKAGMDSASVVARFEAERQALAVMDHPCVAKIFDGGITEPEHGSRPYFAMELVRGEPITDYCDKNRLSIEARVELFKKVCQAVQHAHSKGVIHRDLKPSNIMVAHTDDGPAPKVIDFGVAKAISQRLTEATIFTEQGQMIGTPEYMSPEQAEMAGTDIDTRSDIYSLGVILYELLSGRRPFESAELRQAGLAEIQRIIREDDPPRPSTRVSTAITADAELASKMASMRQSEPRQLERRLRGELDWVVMKCLAKERDRRYESANGLAAELGRYLDGDVVQARPPSRVYRAQKFARKNKAASVAALSIAAVLVAAAGVSLGFAFTAEKEHAKAELALVDRDEALAAETEQRELAENAQVAAETARLEADQRAYELEQVAQFQEEQLGEVDPDGMGLAIRRGLREKLEALAERRGLTEEDRASLLNDYDAMVAGADFTGLALQMLETEIFEPAQDAIERQFADQPLIKARMLHTVANTMRDAGLLALSIEPQAEALSIRRRVLGDEHLHTLSSINSMGKLLLTQGNYAEAELLYREGLKTYRRVLGNEHASTLNSIHNMGVLLRSQGNYAEAELLIREAVETKRRVFGDEHPDTLGSIYSMGNLLIARGEYAEAELLHREVLEIRRRVLGDEHPHTLGSINSMGILLKSRGNLAEAELLYREALKTKRRVFGDEHPGTLLSIGSLGVLLLSLGNHADAELLFREALEVRRRVLGDEHPKTLDSINNMGVLLKELGNYAEAELLCRDAVEISRRVLGNDHPQTLFSIQNMGEVLAHQGKLAEGELLYREALESRRRVLGDEHPETLDSINNLGGLLLYQGKLAEGELLYREALETNRRVRGDEHLRTLGSITNLGSLYNKVGRPEDAAKLFEISLPIKRRVLGMQHPWTGIAMRGLIKAYEKLGRRRDALPLMRELLGLQTSGAKEPDADANTLNEAAWTLLTHSIEELRDPMKALGYAQRACSHEEASAGAKLWMYLDTLALALFETGDVAGAVERVQRAIGLMPESAGVAMVEELNANLAKYEAAMAGVGSAPAQNESAVVPLETTDDAAIPEPASADDP